MRLQTKLQRGCKMNYPNQDDYETEEEYNQALEWYWMEVDRQYDEWKEEQLEKDREWKS